MASESIAHEAETENKLGTALQIKMINLLMTL